MTMAAVIDFFQQLLQRNIRPPTVVKAHSKQWDILRSHIIKTITLSKTLRAIVAVIDTGYTTMSNQ